MVTVTPIYPFFFNGLTLFIITASILMILRQKGSYFRSVKWLFVGAYIAFSITVVLEFLRDIIEQELIGFYYTTIGVSAILAANWMLTVSAVTLSYGHASESILEKIFGHFSWKRILPLGIYSAYVLALMALLWILVPFRIEFLDRRIYGDQALSPIFSDWFGIGLYVLEMMFVIYPAFLLIRRGRKIRSPIASKALPTLAVAWTGVGFVLLLFNGALRMINIEIVDIGNLISASLFVSTIYYFRRTSLLESLFEAPILESVPKVPSQPFSMRLNMNHDNIANKKILFEIDSSARYEAYVKNFVEEALGHSELTIVFTRRGSPVYSVVRILETVRLFLLTPQISYPKHGSRETEMLLPSNDNSIVLSALDKALKASPDSPVSVIFDNLSDMIISQGMEKTYSFLNYALEILSRLNVNAMFLINPESHETKIVSTVRGLFEFHIIQAKENVKVAKSP